MDRSCLKCGRFIDVRGADYLAKEANFTRSIQDLEDILKPLMEEVAKAQAEVDAMEAGRAPLTPDSLSSKPKIATTQAPPDDPRLWFKR